MNFNTVSNREYHRTESVSDPFVEIRRTTASRSAQLVGGVGSTAEWGGSRDDTWSDFLSRRRGREGNHLKTVERQDCPVTSTTQADADGD